MKILIVSGSPKKGGNTQVLIDAFTEGARSKGAAVEVVHAAGPGFIASGCLSCRKCQKIAPYKCAIKDDVSAVLEKMLGADVIVMATPLYFFGPSAQIKTVFDRMFSLYKWDNTAGTMKTPLKGKSLVLLASAYEDVGLDVLEAPFKLTADYTGMKFSSLLVPNAGVSGQLKSNKDVLEQAKSLGSSVK